MLVRFASAVIINKIVQGMGVPLMCRVVRFLAMAFAMNFLGACAFIMSAQAAEKSCLAEPLSATGKPSSIGELARANAFFTWKSVAKDKHGEDYMAWSAATERKLVCIDLMDGENKGKWECTRTARPCKAEVVTSSTEPKCQDEVSVGWGARKGSEAAARAEAQSGWALLVKKEFGPEWAEWELAKSTALECVKKTKWSYQCRAQAYACKR